MVKTVNEGQSLIDIPTPIAVVEHDIVWKDIDFTNIRENKMDNAVITPKTYKIVYEMEY